MSIRIDGEKKKQLKVIASLKGKSMSSIVERLIDQYIEEVKSDIDIDIEIKALMKVSEPGFEDWNNNDDEIYNE